MDYYTVDEVNEKLEPLINEAKTIWNLYEKLKKYELTNKNNLYDKILNKLKYEVMLENELYINIDSYEREVISEYLNNYKFEESTILDKQLYIPVKDAIVTRIKTRIANSIIHDGLKEYDSFSYESSNLEAKSIIENCRKNFYNVQSDINKYGVLDSIINEYSRNYYNILCGQIDKINNTKVKEELINHKYNQLYCDNFMESKILITNNQLLDFFELSDKFINENDEDLKEISNTERNKIFDENAKLDVMKLIELSNENVNSYSFYTKKVLVYTSIRSNIEILCNQSPTNIIAAYADEINNNENIKNPKIMLGILSDINNNLKSDKNNINSIRIRTLQK